MACTTRELWDGGRCATNAGREDEAGDVEPVDGGAGDGDAEEGDAEDKDGGEGDAGGGDVGDDVTAGELGSRCN